MIHMAPAVLATILFIVLSRISQLLLAGSLVYCLLALLGVLRYKMTRIPKPAFPPVTVMRPLAGAADNIEANLRSVFEQKYPAFEVLLSVHEDSDPAAPIATRVMADFPSIPSRLVIAGTSPLPNAKVWSLRAMMGHAAHGHLLMTDSDIRLQPDCLSVTMAELSQPNTALVTCPYRAVGGPGLWSRIEALGLNTDFLAGMLTQRLLNGMDFAIGCTIATRQNDLESIGGLEHLQKYLAEDFMMGNLLHANKRKVVLSRSVIEHHIGDEAFLKNWKHRLRWARSTRRSRRMGYIGELFTKPFALSLLVWMTTPLGWGFVIVALFFRGAVAWCTAMEILDDPLFERYWYLLPLEDIASFITWLLGFFGKTITWRGRKLTVAPDGSLLELVD